MSCAVIFFDCSKNLPRMKISLQLIIKDHSGKMYAKFVIILLALCLISKYFPFSPSPYITKMEKMIHILQAAKDIAMNLAHLSLN